MENGSFILLSNIYYFFLKKDNQNQNLVDLLLTYEFNLKNDLEALHLCLANMCKYLFLIRFQL